MMTESERGESVSSFAVPLTRSEAVVQQLRGEILSRALPPGTVLKDGELAARLGLNPGNTAHLLELLWGMGLLERSARPPLEPIGCAEVMYQVTSISRTYLLSTSPHWSSYP